MKNPYKRTDIFVCNHSSHEKFGDSVSAHHVMNEKNCYPQGCLSFQWKCDLLSKGKTCIRKYKYVGKLCDGCSYFSDDKIHNQPRIVLSPQEFEEFQRQLEEFDDWILEHKDRDLDIWCKVHSVKPSFKKIRSPQNNRFLLTGYLVVIKHGFIHTTEMDDFFFINISTNQQDRYKITAGDTFDAVGRFDLNRGRILFSKIWNIQFEEKSDSPFWNKSDALVAKQSATVFHRQPEQCLHCLHGTLVDVIDQNGGEEKKSRSLYCLKGVQYPENCYVHAQTQLKFSKICNTE